MIRHFYHLFPYAWLYPAGIASVRGSWIVGKDSLPALPGELPLALPLVLLLMVSGGSEPKPAAIRGKSCLTGTTPWFGNVCSLLWAFYDERSVSEGGKPSRWAASATQPPDDGSAGQREAQIAAGERCAIAGRPLVSTKAEKQSLLLLSSFPLRIWKRWTRVGTANIVPLLSLGEMQTLRVLQLLAQGQWGIKIWNPNSFIIAACLGICYMH